MYSIIKSKSEQSQSWTHDRVVLIPLIPLSSLSDRGKLYLIHMVCVVQALSGVNQSEKYLNISGLLHPPLFV